MSRFTRLLKRLDLHQQATDHYLGGAGEGGVGGEARLFGGLVAAQAVMAAQRSVEQLPIHSLHAYFLRPGRAETDIHFRVTRTKSGRNFHVRNVHATQNDELIFQLQASFQRPAKGVEHHAPAPATPPPEGLPNRDQLRGRAYWQDMPVDVRMATPITDNTPAPPAQQVWLRANGEIPDNPHLHIALVVYASDRTLLDTAWRPHANRGQLTGASLDHIMWFHHPPRFDDWLLYAMESPAASEARGLVVGGMYQADRRVVTVAQEGVLRGSSSNFAKSDQGGP